MSVYYRECLDNGLQYNLRKCCLFFTLEFKKKQVSDATDSIGLSDNKQDARCLGGHVTPRVV